MKLTPELHIEAEDDIRRLSESIESFCEMIHGVGDLVKKDGKEATGQIIDLLDQHICTSSLLMVTSFFSIVMERKEDNLTDEQRNEIKKFLEESN